MPYRFNAAYPDYAATPESLFLGLDENNREIGIETERHLITIGGARTGKGAALLIPNARRWPHSLLTIDPKGENAERSYEQREAMGQRVGVLDPFKVADIPDRLRISVNLLAGIDPDGFTAREDLKVIADGMVRRTNPKNAEWDNGARDILAGVLAYVVATYPADQRTLAAARELLLQPHEGADDPAGNPTGLYATAQKMAVCEGGGGLAKSAGVTIMDALENGKGLPPQFLDGARRHSEWLDSRPMRAVLDSSSFDLARLKSGSASLYLVLPPQYIDTHAAFLRLFVRCAINAMAAGGQRGGRCLFMLDEFFALGRIDEIAKAAGLMPSYGVHLWPFLQDLGQLRELYNEAGSQTFFGNSDAAIFFGNTDTLTLGYVSDRLGKLTAREITVPPDLLVRNKLTGDLVDHENAARNAEYNHLMKDLGRPRLTPDEIAALVGKRKGDMVARSMIVFALAGDVLHLRLAPYFEQRPNASQQGTVRTEMPHHAQQKPRIQWLNRIHFVNAIFCAWLAPFLSMLIIVFNRWEKYGPPSAWPTYGTLALIGLVLGFFSSAIFLRRI